MSLLRIRFRTLLMAFAVGVLVACQGVKMEYLANLPVQNASEVTSLAEANLGKPVQVFGRITKADPAALQFEIDRQIRFTLSKHRSPNAGTPSLGDEVVVRGLLSRAGNSFELKSPVYSPLTLKTHREEVARAKARR